MATLSEARSHAQLSFTVGICGIGRLEGTVPATPMAVRPSAPGVVQPARKATTATMISRMMNIIVFSICTASYQAALVRVQSCTRTWLMSRP